MIGAIDGTLLLVILVPCFVPTAIAAARRHRSALGIFLLNLFLRGPGVGLDNRSRLGGLRRPTGPRA